MSFSPGRNVGRVSIRVVPDVRRFRPALKRDLAQIEKTLQMTVHVSKARVNRPAIRRDIEQQLAVFDGLDIASKVRVSVDSARVKRGAVRKSIQQQFDNLGDVRVSIKPQISTEDSERFQRQVRQMVDRAKSTVNIGVNAHTAAATAQLRTVSRPRFAEIFVRVNKASIAKAMTTLAALSGARLSWQWIDDLIEKAARLDKSLPSILGWTSGITALVAALAGSTSGLLGLGQGLFSITPALLVLPGLILNAVGSLTVLIVALRNSRRELGALSDEMGELGQIINNEFWTRTRQPIVDLVTGLMPQLRNAFRDLSAGVGDFTAAMANAFGRELADGRLEGIFRGIAEGWRILGTGAAGFAGALVSLSEIAARYTPRLATWFVRQANTFDAWLTAIATDRRLDRWMEGAIDSMYDLWDATRGFAGVLAGIWTAADLAGSGGLEGFGRLMLQWRDVVNGADFQRGLAAVFRGSYVAMDAFGDAIGSLGRLVADMPREFERFIGSAGGFIGGLLDEAFRALNTRSVSIGLTGLSDGLDEALAKITPALQPIADTFGSFLGLIGELASTVLPTAAGVVGALMPTIDALIGPIESALPGLTAAVDSFVADVAPALTEFAEAISPAVLSIFETLADALEDVGPHVRSLADALSPALVGAIETLAGALKPLADLSSGLYSIVGAAGPALKNGLGWLFDDKELNRVTEEVIANGGWFGDLMREAQNWDRDYVEAAQRHAKTYVDTLSDGVSGNASAMVSRWTTLLKQEFEKNPVAGGEMWETFVGSDLPPNVITQVQANLIALGVELRTGGTTAGGELSGGISGGFNATYPGVAESMRGSITGAFPEGMLYATGGHIAGGLAAGIRDNAWRVAQSALAAANGAMVMVNKDLGIQSPSRKWADKVGHWIPAGIAMGIDRNRGIIDKSLKAATNVSFNGFGAAGAGLGGGDHYEITMPMLPGETPQEQRDNVIKELRWAGSR